MSERVAITEEQHLEKEWYEDARNQTLETLPDFMNHLLNDYQHDYGTICKAIAACGAAAMYAANNTEQGGITGFQAGCINWEVLKAWGEFQTHTGARLINFDNMIYPQYEEKFDKIISKETWESIQKYAKENLLEEREYGLHPEVKAHMESIVAGNVPFGYKIKEK
jgi:hypothetical protein